MEPYLNWHHAAKFSGRIDFSFTRHRPRSQWIQHLESLRLKADRLKVLLTPSPEPKIDFIRLIDAEYPQSLAEQAFAPPILYCLGRRDLLKRPAISIVGSRKSTFLGRQFAQSIGSHATRLGYSVVSGLAYGIDESAHRGALHQTIGIMGQGICAERNGSRAQLCSDILSAGGLLISEFPPEQPPQKWSYLHRNRLIAWMGNPLVLVEAAQRSGAMNTTQLALDAGKKLYVVPHHPLVPSAQGGLNLLLEGAQPLIHPEQLPHIVHQ